MRFINETFFHTDIFIPNLKEDKGLLMYGLFSQKEKECLVMTLGMKLYLELIEQLEWNSNQYQLKEDADDKWKHLIYGTSYEHSCNCCCCKEKYWRGIIVDETIKVPPTPTCNDYITGVQNKISFLSYYIYYYWSLQNETISSGTGEKVPEVKNSMSVTNVHKRTNAWNYFNHWVVGNCSNDLVSLYDYLNDHCDLFPNWCGIDRCNYGYKSIYT